MKNIQIWISSDISFVNFLRKKYKSSTKPIVLYRKWTTQSF